jgi:hypothetical protein
MVAGSVLRLSSSPPHKNPVHLSLLTSAPLPGISVRRGLSAASICVLLIQDVESSVEEGSIAGGSSFTVSGSPAA